MSIYPCFHNLISFLDYGGSYYDVVQALILALDSLDSNEEPSPVFKYVNALRDQVMTVCSLLLALYEFTTYEFFSRSSQTPVSMCLQWHPLKTVKPYKTFC